MHELVKMAKEAGKMHPKSKRRGFWTDTEGIDDLAIEWVRGEVRGVDVAAALRKHTGRYVAPSNIFGIMAIGLRTAIDNGKLIIKD